MGATRVLRSVVLDASALTEASGPAAGLRLQLRRAVSRGASLHVSAATLTEVLRGHPRDVLIHRLLALLDVHVVDAAIGRAAGERIGRTGGRGNVTLDALVAEVAGSLPRPVAVFTADANDLRALVDPDVMVLDIAG